MAASGSRLDFLALLDQHERILKVQSALPHLALVPERMRLVESVNAPLDRSFDLWLDCVSTSAHFELKALIGEQITVELMQAAGYKRLHGYVTQAIQRGGDGGLARWRLRMSPFGAFLALRRDSFIWQDKTALDIMADVMADHPSAQCRVQVARSLAPRSLCTQYQESDAQLIQRLLAEEGLSWHVEHLQDDEAVAASNSAGHARHVLVITDARAGAEGRQDLGSFRFGVPKASASSGTSALLALAERAAGISPDTVQAFNAQRGVGTNAITVGAWDYKRVAGVAGADSSALAIGEVGSLENYDGSGAYRYPNAEAAQLRAEQSLAVRELAYKRHEGLSGVRHLQVGAVFELIDHPHYGANRTSLSYLGALAASHQRSDNRFAVTQVVHEAANNLGAQASQVVAGLAALAGEQPAQAELERGAYRNHFVAVPADVPLMPTPLPKPTVDGALTAWVVGLPGQMVTADRDQRVKLQFAWQRGDKPNRGGLPHGGAELADASGNAPGDHRSGTWVRVAQPTAGANWGAVFTPRIGSEVLVQFVEGDIDRPLVVGQLYNGQQRPPYSAGYDSGVNHPGVISGVLSQALDGGGNTHWVTDDATGQLRTRLHASHAQAELSLGHLISQPAALAQRGAWRGSGFEGITQAWASVRAPQGLLLSTTTRAGTYGSAYSTQMDSSEALAQLNAARALGTAISQAASAAGAQPLASHDDNQALYRLARAIDPQQDGRHPAQVNGQQAQQAKPGSRDLQDPVHAYHQPHLVVEGPSSIAKLTEGDMAHFAGLDFSRVTQGDQHEAAAFTHSQVSGQTGSYYSHDGRVQIKAAAGPVSLRAHTDKLEILADKDVQIISVNDEIRIEAKTRIELVGGDSSVVLEGGDVTFTTPGKFEVKSGKHEFLGGGSAQRRTLLLPDSKATLFDERFELRDVDGSVLARYPYRITTVTGITYRGVTDSNGLTERIHTERAEGLKIESDLSGLA